MTPLSDLIATSLVIVAGKGGVGKTTVTAVLARAANDSGRRVLVVELDGKSTIDELVPDLDIRHISAPDSLEEYLHEHGFRRIAKRLAATGVIDVIGTAAPGIDDLVVLGKIKQLERSGEWDTVIVDGPAAGHAITFLTSAAGLLDAVRGGPVHAQARDVLAMLADPDRCQVVLVTVPETTPVNELVETAFAIEERVGAQIGPVIVNQVDVGPDLPDPAEVRFGRAKAQVADAIAAAEFRRARRAVQRVELDRLASALPLPRVTLAARPVAGLGADDVVALARSLVLGPTPGTTSVATRSSTPSVTGVGAVADAPIPDGAGAPDDPPFGTAATGDRHTGAGGANPAANDASSRDTADPETMP